MHYPSRGIVAIIIIIGHSYSSGSEGFLLMFAWFCYFMYLILLFCDKKQNKMREISKSSEHKYATSVRCNASHTACSDTESFVNIWPERFATISALKIENFRSKSCNNFQNFGKNSFFQYFGKNGNIEEHSLM